MIVGRSADPIYRAGIDHLWPFDDRLRDDRFQQKSPSDVLQAADQHAPHLSPLTGAKALPAIGR
jgi:hypothetical protein